MIIPGFPDYDITEAGAVSRISTGKVVEPVVTHLSGSRQYLRVCLLGTDGIYRMHNVMKLLALAYLEKPEGATIVVAKDRNNLNIALDNIEWTTHGKVVKAAWDEGRISDRRPRPSSCNEDSIEMLHNTMLLLDGPTTMTELSYMLQVPYSVVRYSMAALRERKLVRKTEKGFEVVR